MVLQRDLMFIWNLRMDTGSPILWEIGRLKQNGYPKTFIAIMLAAIARTLLSCVPAAGEGQELFQPG